MKYLHIVAYVLLFIGGINWGLVGIGGFAGGDWNVVSMILGSWPAVEWLVYVLVGLSAVYLAATHKSYCKNCMAGGSGMGGGMV